MVEVFQPQPLIPGSQGSETVSLPYGASAFDQGQYTTRDNRMLIEGVETQNLASLQFASGLMGRTGMKKGSNNPSLSLPRDPRAPRG
jgi:hypothetical protein